MAGASRAARRSDLIAQQHADFPDLRDLVMVAACPGNAAAARAAWRSAEALALYRLNALDAHIKGALERGIAAS